LRAKGFSLKENIQHFKTWNFLFFLFLWIIFALLDPDPESESGIRIRNPNPESESGIRNPNPESESGIRIRNPNPESESGIRIRNPNPESESGIRIGSGIQNPNPNPDPLIWLNLDPKHCFFGWNNYFSANNWKECCCKMRKSREKIQMAFNFVTVLIYHVHSPCKGVFNFVI
jgi:hypothetical protein